MHEFQSQWREFVNNPYSNLTQTSAQDVLDDIVVDQGGGVWVAAWRCVGSGVCYGAFSLMPYITAK